MKDDECPACGTFGHSAMNDPEIEGYSFVNCNNKNCRVIRYAVKE